MSLYYKDCSIELFSVAFSLLFCSVSLHDRDSTFSLVSINIFHCRYHQTVYGSLSNGLGFAMMAGHMSLDSGMQCI
jgi:hypothetical protein